MLQKLIVTAPAWMTLPLRLIVGGIFIMYGAEKVFGIQGGPGLSAWVAKSSYAPPFLRPAWLWLGAAAFCELIGGILIFFGLLTRLGALLIVPVMGVAIYSQWISNASIRFPLGMLAVALALIIAGGGQASIDQKLSHRRRRY